MLKITRHAGQSVRIGTADVKVLEIDPVRGYVKLGIAAPLDVEIVRDDVINKEVSPKRRQQQ